ncbi:MAG: 4-(cytidine 5'-diphospho)-2-C-methyl-D-erythritol kinase [Clostridia bacterium]|nr:4-(cytidine 5'-diphospho)-2-C-methyl-D-erythritol kinase [Clostridia bacterium]
MKIIVLAPAKINLSLDVKGKRADGYHTLQTVFQAIDWYDRITVETLPERGAFAFSCSDKALETEKNTAHKAAALFRQVTNFTEGISIIVEKSIPQQAGLAGGSADAAGVLAALNALADYPLPEETLWELGAKIGADVPFCLCGGTALGVGTGTELTPLSPLSPCYIVIAKPEGGVSTPKAYALLDSAENLFHPDVDGMYAALQAGDADGVFSRVGNSFEQPLSLPETEPICCTMREHGAKAAALSGSGSAVFGIFSQKEAARHCADILQKKYPQTRLCQPCSGILLEKIE